MIEQKSSRRDFMKATVCAGAFPTIIPATVLGADSPSHNVHIAQIGCGRIAASMDVRGFLRTTKTRVVAVCDLDSRRLIEMRRFVEKAYAKRGNRGIVATAHDFHDLLQRSDIDAVSISTPDHWHVQVAVEAAFAGKHVYMQKPTSLTIREGRIFSDAIAENDRIFLLGSQQRSMEQFIQACEFVREGRLGKVTRIEIGLPGDPPGGSTKEMPVPKNLDYDFWLGSTPQVYYTEDRVHSQNMRWGLTRPGWLRCEQFGAGMITGWGSHHLDIAHWAMDWEKIGPRFIEGRAQFLTGGLWDVHSSDDVKLTYPDGTLLHVCDRFPNGVRFIGEKGWIFVNRGATKTTASDPITPNCQLKALDASDPKLIAGSSKVRLYRHPGSHHQNFIDSVLTHTPSVVSAETAHRSCSACLLSWIGMKLGRRLEWDWKAERFVNDPEADALLARTERAPYGAWRAYRRLSKKSSV